MSARKLFNLTMALLLMFSLMPGAVSAQTSTPEAESQTTNYILTLPMPEVQIPKGTPAARVAGIYQVALHKTWRQTEAMLASLKEIGLVTSYTLLADQNAFEVTVLPAATEQLAQIGTLSTLDKASLAMQSTGRVQAELQAAIQGALRQERLSRPEAKPEVAPRSPRTYYIALETEPAAKERGLAAVGGQLSALKQDGMVGSFEWLPELNAFKVVATKELNFLAELPGVAGVSTTQPAMAQPEREARPEARRLAGAGSIAAITATTPFVRVYVYSNEVYLQSSSNLPVTLTLRDPDGEVKNEPLNTSFNGWYFDGIATYDAYAYLYDSDGYSVNMQPGDTLHVAQDGQTAFDFEIPELFATIDRPADEINGVGPANITSLDPTVPPVMVVSGHGFNDVDGLWQETFAYVTTDADGDFSTQLECDPGPCKLDLRGDSWGYQTYTDANGNQASKYFHAPQLNVNLYSGYVWGYAEPFSEVTVRLLNPAGVTRADFTMTASTYGDFWGELYDPYGHYVPVTPGDSVVLESPLASITVEAVEISAVGDTATNVVSGNGPVVPAPADYVPPYLEACGEGVCTSLTTNASGDFSALLGDLVAGSGIYFYYATAEADWVTYDFQIPQVFVRGWDGGFGSDNYVSGRGYPGLVMVSLKRGADTLATEYYNAYGTYWEVGFEDLYGNPVPIQGGDQIEVIQEPVTTSLVVPAFTDLVSDVEADQVTGTTNAAVTSTVPYAPGTLAVWPNSTVDWDAGKHVLPVAGSFTAANPFHPYADPLNGDVTVDIYPGNQGHLRYINTAGHYIFEDFTAPSSKPVVSVRGSYWNWYYVDEGYVSGYVSGACSSQVDITVRDSGGVVKGSVDNVGACPDFGADIPDAYGNPIQIAAGDSVEVSYRDATTIVEVPAFTELVSDVDADQVTGNTDAVVSSTDPYALETLAVWPNSISDWDAGKNVDPDAAGDFTAVNPFYWETDPIYGDVTVDIYPGDFGHLRYIDAEGNRIYAAFMAPQEVSALTIYARGFWDYYEADNFAAVVNPSPDCDVELELQDSAGEVKASASLWACWGGYDYVWFDGPDGWPIDILPGDKLVATNQGVTTTVVVPEFQVTSDSQTDSLSGTTDAEVTSDTFGEVKTLAVWPTSWSDGGAGKYVDPDAAGDFTAENPFYWEANPAWGSTYVDIEPGHFGHLRYIDAAGNHVYDDFASLYLEPELWIQKDANWLGGYWTEAETELQVSLTRAGSEVASLAALTNQYGWFGLSLYDDTGLPAFILEGDTLTVSDGGASETVLIPPLTAVADHPADTIRGEAPPNSPLSVYAEWTSVPAISDADGAYTADFRGVYDLVPGDEYGVDYLNPDGHTIFVTSFIGPQITSLLNSASVWGIGTASNQGVDVTLRRAGSDIAWDTTSTGWDHWFGAYLFNTAGQPAQIKAGDQSKTAFEDGSILSMIVADLTALVDAAADLISGTGPAGEPLDVDIAYPFPGYVESVTPDAAGEWQVDAGAAGYNVVPGTEVRVRHTQTLEAETWLYATAPVVYVRGYDSGPWDYAAENYVSGYAAGPGSVEVSLERGGEVIAHRLATTYEDGYFGVSLYDDLDLPANILGGDQVLVNDVSVTVPEIQAELDEVANTVSGFGPPNAKLGIYVSYPAYQNQTVTTAADGSFSASFGEIYPNTYATIRYVNPDGNWIQTRFWAPPSPEEARIEARWNYYEGEACDSCVSGYAGTQYTPVHLSLVRGGETIAAAVDLAYYEDRYFGELTDNSGAPVAIQPGDAIEMLAGGITTSMTVAALTAQVNPESGVLFGEGPAGGRIYASWWGWIDIGADGRYFADIGADSGDRGYVYYADADGNRTYVGWAYPRIWIRANSNYVSGYVDPNVPVLVELFDSGGSLKASAETTSSIWDGYFAVYFTNLQGDPIIIQPGDIVAVTASPTTEIVVPELTAVVDKANDLVTGLGPADSQLYVYVDSGSIDVSRNPFTDASGAYSADFSDAINILGGDYVYVEAMLPDGNGVWLETYAPMVNVNTANDIVDGYTAPMASLSLDLVRGGSTIASVEAEAGYWNGFFTAFFTDAEGELVDILPGDTVEVIASPTESFTTVAITAVINPATGTISGTGPVNATLLVKAFVWFTDPYDMEEYYDYETLPAYTDATGKYTVDFSTTLPLDNTSHVYIEYRDSTGNVSSFNTLPERLPAVDIVSQWVQDDGAQVRKVYAGVANSGDITPPIRLQSAGDDLYIEAYNGDLIITTPDGTVINTYESYFYVEDAGEGVWQIQIRKFGTNGSPYAFAIGAIPPYRIYAPLGFKASP